MIELLKALVATPFGIGSIVAAAAAVAAILFVPVRGLQLAAGLAVVAVTLAGCGYVHRLTIDLAAAKAEVETLTIQVDAAEAKAADNAAAAGKLSRQQAIDAASSDQRLGDLRTEFQKRMKAREAIARIEGADAVVCPGPGGKARARTPAVPPAIDAALDALATPGRHP